jgi:hypothetical protein
LKLALLMSNRIHIRWNFYKALDIIVFQGGDDGRGYREVYKIPRGPFVKEGAEIPRPQGPT